MGYPRLFATESAEFSDPGTCVRGRWKKLLKSLWALWLAHQIIHSSSVLIRYDFIGCYNLFTSCSRYKESRHGLLYI
jgi:hypothetical protein